MALAVLGSQADAPADRVAGTAGQERASLEQSHRAAEGGGGAEERLHELGAARAHEAGEAQDLAAWRVEGHGRGRPGHEQVLDGEQRVRGRRAPAASGK